MKIDTPTSKPVFVTIMEVRVTDLNYGGHLANDKMLAFFHEARVRFLAALGLSEADVGAGVALTQTEAWIQYKAELFLGDQVEIRIWADEVGKARFRLVYEVSRCRDAVLAAQGYLVLAGFDYHRHRPSRLPGSFCERLQGQ